MATTKTYKPNQLYGVPLADLQADANQPRKENKFSLMRQIRNYINKL